MSVDRSKGTEESPAPRPAGTGLEPRSPEDVVVVGGGLLGAALARQAAAGGARVLVCSRTPRGHAGMWCAFDAATGRCPLPAGARVLVALAPRDGEAPDVWAQDLPRIVTAAWRDGARAVTVCGPAGEGEPGVDAFRRGLQQIEQERAERGRASAPGWGGVRRQPPGEGLPPLRAIAGAGRTTTVRFGPLFGTDDRWIWPAVRSLRDSGTGRLPRAIPRTAPLWVEDAARAVLRSEEGDRTLRGPEALDGVAIADALTRRYGGRCTVRWWGGPSLKRMSVQTELRDEWDDARFGARTSFATWAEKLPGPRRGR